MYRNVSLRRREVDGLPTWVLLGPDGTPVAAFAAFVKALGSAPKNTRDAYCRHLAEFLDYLLESTKIFGGGQPLTKSQLTESFEAYDEYLQLGLSATKPIAKAVAQSLLPTPNKGSSVTPKKAAVRRFLKLSERFHSEQLELGQISLGPAPAAESSLVPEFRDRRQLSPYEIHAMQANSMLAGVVAGGPKFISAVPLGDTGRAAPYDDRRAYPYDKVADLISAMPTYRDKALYALLAASGCRTHEALQLLFEDINIREATVRLVDPATRAWHPSYAALLPDQRQRLAWKGRTTDLTLLIEPFASLFFESLERYLATEYVAHGKTDFVFQYLNNEHRGDPYFLSAASSRLETFHQVSRDIDVALPQGVGPHSLRHMYGTYCLNYFPRANGDFGLPVPMVQQLLGHASPKETLKYAKYDSDLLKLELENANRVLFRNGTPMKLLELKVLALEGQLAKVKANL